MWTISSNDLQQAKDLIDLRRIEIETRYADEKKVLDTERAAIETLERAAAEFANRLVADLPGAGMVSAGVGIDTAGEPQPPIVEPPMAEPTVVEATAVESAESQNVDDGELPSETEFDAAGGAETNLAFDILKPGSRWRLNRASRLLNPDGGPTNPSSTYPSSST
jgi:hypothetical protein